MPTLTIAEIVAQALPGATEADLDRVRVTMTSGDQWTVVPRRWWRHVRPHGGTRIALRVVPGEPTTIANFLTAQFVNLTGVTSLGALQGVYVAAFGLASLGVSALAGAVLTALIPPPELPDGPTDPERRYSLQGWKNQIAPGDPVPLPMGTIRVAPLYAMQPYQVIVGDDQFILVLFCFGIGRLDISDIRIGDTSIDEFEDVEYEVLEGADDDDPVTITPIQVLEEAQQIELVYEYGLDSEGNEDTAGGLIEQPVVRTTAADSVRASLIFSFPNGLYRVDDGVEKKRHCRYPHPAAGKGRDDLDDR